MKKREAWARKCLVELVKHVFAQQGKPLPPLSYQELARRIGLRNKNGGIHSRLGRTLGIMGHMIAAVKVEPPVAIPMLQALAVGKNSGVPDGGMDEFWPGYAELEDIEKENMAKAEWREIEAFGARWNTVLEKLHEAPVPLPELAVLAERALRYGGCGGESPAHKALKALVIANPALVGVDKEADAIPEYKLPSLDRIDVLFKSPGQWTAVEVKSCISDEVEGDYERGVFQAIKYEAILNAMRSDKDYKVPMSIRVVLLLENQLPEKLAILANALKVTVVDHIKPVAKP